MTTSEARATARAAPGKGLENFQEMEEVVTNLERLSGEARKAYEREHGGDDLAARLEEFQSSAGDVRKAFKRATGTGLGGTVRRFLHATDTGREVKSGDFKLKARDLIRLGREVDSQIESHPPDPGTQEYWREIQRNLSRLATLI